MAPTPERSVSFLTPKMQGGGAERLLWLLLRALDRSLFSPRVISLEHGAPPWPVDCACDFVYPAGQGPRPLVPGLPWTSRLDIAWRLWKVARRLPRAAPVVVFLESTGVHFLPAHLLTGRPYVLFLAVGESAYFRQLYPNRLRYRLESFLLALACRRAQRVVVLNQATADDLVAHFSVARRKIVVVPAPVDLDEVEVRSRQASPFENLMAAPTFLSVARLVEQKNHGLLLDAAALLQRRGEVFRVLIEGEGPLLAALEKRRDDLGLGEVVTFLGRVDNPMSLMRRASALVLSSRFESSPLVAIEAMACGTPVISTDCPAGVAEMLERGESGLLVPVDDAAALCDAMQRILHDAALVARLRARGLARARWYDLSKVVKEWEALL